MLVTLGGCDRPATAPAKPLPARPSEQWRSVRLPTRENCDSLGCLVGLSGVNRPTIVSVRLLPISFFRADPRCLPAGLPPEMDGPHLSIGSWLSFAHDLPISFTCPAFAPVARLRPWRRGDNRDPFEAQNSLAYGFLPAGYIDDVDERRIRCVMVFDPVASQFDLPKSTLRQAAETCAVLFYFREDR